MSANHPVKRRRTEDFVSVPVAPVVDPTELSKHDGSTATASPQDSYITKLNRSVVSMFTKTLQKDPQVDLSTILAKYHTEYSGRRARAKAKDEERCKKNEEPDSKELAEPPKAEVPSAPTSVPIFSSVATVSSMSRWLKHALYIPGEHSIDIVRPLSSKLNTLLGSPPSHAVFRQAINAFAKPPLHSLNQTHVLKLSDNIIVKIQPSPRENYFLPENEHDVLTYLRPLISDLPVSEPLGVIRIGELYYSFTTFIPGQSGDKAWPYLTDSQKERLKCDLGMILSKIRSIPNDSGAFGFNGVCKDLRRHQNVVKDRITTITEFNDFLLHSRNSRISDEHFEFLKERVLTKDGENTVLDLVFSHADLHPRNLLIKEDGSLSGIIDWENAGWYPKYWEGVKALNTISFSQDAEGKDNDWWKYIPEGVFDGPAWAIDTLISKATGRG